MPRIKIDSDKCKSCMLCVYVCPKQIIKKSKEINKRGFHSVECSESQNEDKGECTGCALCAIMCPDLCIEVWK